MNISTLTNCGLCKRLYRLNSAFSDQVKSLKPSSVSALTATSTPRRASLPHIKILDAERLLLKERAIAGSNGHHVSRKLEPSNSEEDSFWGSDLEEEEELLVSGNCTNDAL